MATSWNGLSFIFSKESYMTLILILAVTILWLLWSVSSYFRYRNRLPVPPGNLGFPFIGQTVEFLLANGTTDGIRLWMQNKISKHGPIFKWRFLGYTMVMMDQPEGNKFVLQNEGTSNHIFWPFQICTLLGPESLLIQSGERHKLARLHINRFFDHTAISRYLHGVNLQAIRHFADHWQGKEQLVALDVINLYTLSIICNLLMSLEDGPLMDKFLAEFDIFTKGAFCLPINLPGFQYNKALKARKSLLEMLDGLLEQRRREIAEARVPEASQIDILQKWLTVPDEEGNLLPDSFIKDNLILLLLAGFDTSSRTLAMTIYYIARNPHVYEEIIQEHKSILEEKRTSGKDDRELTTEDICAMKYTWRVLQETLRLQPVLLGGHRKTVRDLEYKGYYIPEGWVLSWNNRDSNYSPKYFKDPLNFDPSRWEERSPPFTYLPFGGGSHICLGYEFAKTAMCTFIHHLVRSYSWSLVNPNYDGPFIRDPIARTLDKTSIIVKQL
ncbi:hypothetical protein R1sor_002871 [Riccia sorocarpa]|uniref:Cytochrome P450 n=1 Tax=Riccia sorocarpa TaxID=122646 RepID=A0ABD3H3X9_9MARC